MTTESLQAPAVKSPPNASQKKPMDTSNDQEVQDTSISPCEYITKALDTLQVGDMEDCAQVYLELQSKLRSNSSDEAPVLCALLPEVAKFCEMLLRDVKIALRPDALNERQIELIVSCLRCLGFFIHHVKIIEALGPASCNNLLNLLCQVILQANEKHICSIAVWCITSQRLPATLLSQNSLILAQALSFGMGKPFDSANIVIESLNALVHVCKKDPHSMLRHVKEFLIKLLWFAIDSDASVREKAGHLLNCVSNNSYRYHSEYEPIIIEFFKDHAESYGNTLEKLVLPEKRLVKLWMQLVVILDKFLLHSTLMQQMMKILEGCFNHPNPDIRCASFHAWERLVDLFDKDGYSNNRMRIIMLPLVNTFTNDRVKKVRLSAMKLWPKILHAIPNDLPAFFEDAILTPVKALNTETETELMVYTTRIISNMVLGYTKKQQKGHAQNPKSTDGGFSVDPKWLRSQTEFILDFISVFNLNNSKIYLQTLSIWKNMLDNLTQLNISEIQHTGESISAVRHCFAFIQNMIKTNYESKKLSFKIISDFVTGLQKHLGDRIMKSQAYSIPPKNITPQEELKNISMELHVIFSLSENQSLIEGESEFKEYLAFFYQRESDYYVGHAWHVACESMISFITKSSSNIKISDHLKDIMDVLFFPFKKIHVSFVPDDETELRFVKSWLKLFEIPLQSRKFCKDEIKVVLNEMQKLGKILQKPFNLFIMYVIATIYATDHVAGLTKPEHRSFRVKTRDQLATINLIEGDFTVEFARIYVKCLISRWQREFEALNDPHRAELREMAIQYFSVYFRHFYNLSANVQKELSNFADMIRGIWKDQVLPLVENRSCDIAREVIFKSGLLCRDVDIRKCTMQKYDELKSKNANYAFMEDVEQQKLVEQSQQLNGNEKVDIEMEDINMADEQSSSPLKQEDFAKEEETPAEQTPIKKKIETAIREPLKDRTVEILSVPVVQLAPAPVIPSSVVTKRKADSTMDFQSPPSILKKRSSKDTPNKNRRVSFQLEGETPEILKGNVPDDINDFTSIEDNRENIDPMCTQDDKEIEIREEVKISINGAPPSVVTEVKYDSEKMICDLKSMNEALTSLSSEELFRLQGHLQTATAQVFTEIQKRFT